MVVEQQLLDYIKKAKEAGQSDDQTRSLLYKNGWTEAEVREAFASLSPQQEASKIQPQSGAQAMRPKPESKMPAQQSVQTKPTQQLVAQTQKPVQEEKSWPDLSLGSKTESSQPKINTQPKMPAQSDVQLKQQEQPKPETKMPVQQPAQTKSTQQPQIRVSPQPSASPVPAQEVLQTKPKSHILSKIIITLLTLIILGGVGYFIAGIYIDLPWKLSWNIFGQNPEKVINKMLDNMASLKLYSSEIKIEASLADNETKTSTGKLSINIDSQTNATDLASNKSMGSIKIDFTGPENSSMASFNMNLVSIGEDAYIKIDSTTLPEESTMVLSESDINIDEVVGKWLKLDKDSIKALSQMNDDAMMSENMTQQTAINMMQKMKEIFVSQKILSDVTKMPDEVVNGQDAYHYVVNINNDKLKSLINALIMQAVATAEQNSEGDQDYISLAKNMASSFVDSFATSLGDVNLNLWIGKNDNLLYKYGVVKSFNLNDFMPATLNLKVEGLYSDFDQPIIVQAPEGAQKIEEVLSPLIKIQTIKTDLSRIASYAQMAFDRDASYESLCNRGLLNGYLEEYGEQLIDLHKNILDQGGTKPACYSRIQGYCVSTQLANGSYLCVGDTGAEGTTKCVSASTVCK